MDGLVGQLALQLHPFGDVAGGEQDGAGAGVVAPVGGAHLQVPPAAGGVPDPDEEDLREDAGAADRCAGGGEQVVVLGEEQVRGVPPDQLLG